MVSALFRKDSHAADLKTTSINHVNIWQSSTSKNNKNDFPYALQVFINSHMDLPSLDEITEKQSLNILRTNIIR